MSEKEKIQDSFDEWYFSNWKSNPAFIQAQKAHDTYYKYLKEVCVERELHLTQKLAIAIEALEYYEKFDKYGPQSQCAREALEKLKS